MQCVAAAPVRQDAVSGSGCAAKPDAANHSRRARSWSVGVRATEICVIRLACARVRGRPPGHNGKQSYGKTMAVWAPRSPLRIRRRSAQKRSALLCLPLCSNAFTMRNIFASCLGRPRTSTTHGEQTQTHAPQIMPQRSMPATPTLDQSPLQGLRHRPARSPRPTTPSALPLRSATPLRSKWERRALERFQPMAHQLVDLIKRTRGHAALSAQQQSAMTLLNRIRACAAGEKSPSGGDDIDARI